jgi:hypothetical protein
LGGFLLGMVGILLNSCSREGVWVCLEAFDDENEPRGAESELLTEDTMLRRVQGAMTDELQIPDRAGR